MATALHLGLMEMGFLSFNFRAATRERERYVVAAVIRQISLPRAALRNQNPLMGICHIMSNLQFSHSLARLPAL
jgi:hypothetical protein